MSPRDYLFTRMQQREELKERCKDGPNVNLSQ